MSHLLPITKLATLHTSPLSTPAGTGVVIWEGLVTSLTITNDPKCSLLTRQTCMVRHILSKDLAFVSVCVGQRRIALDLRSWTGNRRLRLRLAGGCDDPDVSPLKEGHFVY